MVFFFFNTIKMYEPKVPKPYIPHLPVKNLRLGVAVWPQMRPECIGVPGMECDPGLELEIFTSIAMMLNLSLQLKFATKSGCGNKNVNGTWDGLLGMLYENKIDAIGNLCALDVNRSQATWLKYSWPILHSKQAYLLKAPEPKYFFHIEAPFQSVVWMIIFIMIVVFATLFAFTYKVLSPNKKNCAFIKALNDVVHIISGTNYDGTVEKIAWILFSCFIGFVMVVYSTFITVAILKPIPIERPFKNNAEFAEALSKGSYKLLDFNSPSRYPCFAASCDKISRALVEHGYHYFKQPNTENGTNLLLNEILKYENLVLARSKYQIRGYLDAFPNRSKLWLFNDDSSGEEWSVFFYANHSRLSKYMDKAIIHMSDAKRTLNELYFGLSYQATNVDSIKGKVPEKVKLDLKLIYGPLVCYGCGMGLAIVTYVTELILGPKRLKVGYKSY